MITPASQPHFDSQMATPFPEAIWPVNRHTFLAYPSTSGLDIQKSVEVYAIIAVQTFSLFMRLNTMTQGRQGSVAQQVHPCFSLD